MSTSPALRVAAQLERLLAGEDSLFRAQLLREDIARLARLQTLAREASDLPAFKRAGMRIGWTQGDARTHELAGELDTLLGLVYRRERGAAGEDVESAIERAWATFHRLRLERLVGCLATPTPKPED